MGALALKNEIKQRVAVIGMGITGNSCTRWLLNHGYEVVMFDSRSNPPGLEMFKQEFPDVDVHLGELHSDALAQYSQVVCSPGISIKIPPLKRLTDDKVQIVGDVELFAREVTSPVVAITGSNGKTTVTTLVGEIAKAAGVDVGVAGNIGTPVLDSLDENHALYVLELSSFQLDTTQSLHPEVSVVLNVSPDHMDRYDSYGEYVDSKARIYRGAESCVVNRDDVAVAKMPVEGRVIGFTLHEPQENDFGLKAFDGKLNLCQGDRAIMPVDELKIAGQHNYANALAVLAICSSLNIDEEVAKSVLRNFTGLAHRTQLVATVDGVRWFNDSKGTNVGATIAAVQGLSESVVLIAGGQSKGQDFSPLKQVIKDKAKAVLLFGEDSQLIAQALGDEKNVRIVSDLPEAVDVAIQLVEPGDDVLFSPACASFDMFKNYEERGKAFVSEVMRRLGQ